jgi:hypothetical protein
MTLMVASLEPQSYSTSWLHASQVHSIQVLLQPNPRWVATGDQRDLANFVRRYQHDPAVYGWYLYDEPDFYGLPAARLIAAYRTIRAIDHRPIAVDFFSGNCLFGPGKIDRAYLNGFDLLMFDHYIFYQKSFYENLPHFDPLADERKVDANCVASARKYHKLGPIIVLQGFGKGTRDGPFNYRDPTYHEVLCSILLAERAGATGGLFYRDGKASANLHKNIYRAVRVVHSFRNQTSVFLISRFRCTAHDTA